jgi:hypothetical protein
MTLQVQVDVQLLSDKVVYVMLFYHLKGSHIALPELDVHLKYLHRSNGPVKPRTDLHRPQLVALGVKAYRDLFGSPCEPLPVIFLRFTDAILP